MSILMEKTQQSSLGQVGEMPSVNKSTPRNMPNLKSMSFTLTIVICNAVKKENSLLRKSCMNDESNISVFYTSIYHEEIITRLHLFKLLRQTASCIHNLHKFDLINHNKKSPPIFLFQSRMHSN